MTRPSAAPVDAEIPVVRSIRRALSSRENAGGGCLTAVLDDDDDEEDDDEVSLSLSWSFRLPV